MSVHSVLLLKVCMYRTSDIMITGCCVCYRRESACSMVSRVPDNCLLWINQKGRYWKVTMAIKMTMCCKMMKMVHTACFLKDLCCYNLLSSFVVAT